VTPWIAGTGWVTPLGCEAGDVWAKVRAGETARFEEVAPPWGGRPIGVARVTEPPPDALARHPRLRRASGISLFGATAARAALEETGRAADAECGLVFAVSSGGVIYTRRFFEGILNGGPQGASPLLFPETVYNAAASHVAAVLGIEGPSCTVVGDFSVGLTALDTAAGWIRAGRVERCLVVASEEFDPVVAEAYRSWGLGLSFGEGAAAVLLASEGRSRLAVASGFPYFRRSEAEEALRGACGAVGTASRAVVGANGTPFDRLEDRALAAVGGVGERVVLKRALGEAPGASALMAVVAAEAWSRAEGGAPVLVTAPGCHASAGAARVGG
jgi:hypothetical protein